MLSALLAQFAEGTSKRDRDAIAKTLTRFGEGVLAFTAFKGIQVRALQDGERYNRASPALARLGIDVDAWPAPPAGLFVVEERRGYLRSVHAMNVGPGVGPALDSW